MFYVILKQNAFTLPIIIEYIHLAMVCFEKICWLNLN